MPFRVDGLQQATGSMSPGILDLVCRVIGRRRSWRVCWRSVRRSPHVSPGGIFTIRGTRFSRECGSDRAGDAAAPAQSIGVTVLAASGNGAVDAGNTTSWDCALFAPLAKAEGRGCAASCLGRRRSMMRATCIGHSTGACRGLGHVSHKRGVRADGDAARGDGVGGGSRWVARET